MKMKKMEQEMEEVFEMKVQEKLQKLRDIEADVSVCSGVSGDVGVCSGVSGDVSVCSGVSGNVSVCSGVSEGV